jgi:hypothetical protein
MEFTCNALPPLTRSNVVSVIAPFLTHNTESRNPKFQIYFIKAEGTEGWSEDEDEKAGRLCFEKKYCPIQVDGSGLDFIIEYRGYTGVILGSGQGKVYKQPVQRRSTASRLFLRIFQRYGKYWV